MAMKRILFAKIESHLTIRLVLNAFRLLTEYSLQDQSCLNGGPTALECFDPESKPHLKVQQCVI